MTRKRSRRKAAATPTVDSRGKPAALAAAPYLATVTGITAGLVLACVGLVCSSRALAMYYSPRVMLFYPLVVALLILTLIGARRRESRPEFDLLDVALAVFVLLQILAAATSSSQMLAWFGAYNRAGGAVLWAALAVLLFVGRRLLGSRPALEPLAWIASAVICAAAVVAALQALGATTPWPFDDIWAGRSAGTTGNPLGLAGLCLLSVWLGIMSATSPLRKSTRVAMGVASAMGGVAIVLSVSRAAYLGLGAALILLAVVWVLERRWRFCAALAGIALVLLIATLVYDPGHTGAGALAARLSADPAASTYGLSQPDVSRGTFWRVGVDAVKARPWLGYGPGAFVVAYRRFVPAATLRDAPLSAVTDPHALPLLVATGSGLPGLILAVAVVVLVALRAFRQLRRPDRTARPREPDEVWNATLASSAAALALLVFLSVSPGDLTALAPLALMLGMAAGAPRPAEPALLSAIGAGAWRAIWIASLGVAIVLLALATAAGVQLYRADVAARDVFEHPDQIEANKAADLMAGVATYDLLAWDGAVRQAAATGRTNDPLPAGERRLRAALAADPTSPVAQIAEVRYRISLRQVDQAMTHIRAGLADNPSNPLLQGLWGYITQALARDQSQAARAATLAQELDALPDKGADGYYWLSVAYGALGDRAAQARALGEARKLAPALAPKDYEGRIRGDF